MILTARKQAELDEAVAHITVRGGKALGIAGDLSKIEEIPISPQKVLEASGSGVQILVNNAGATWGAPAEDYPLDAGTRS